MSGIIHGLLASLKSVALKYSNYFDGSGDYLRAPDNSAFSLGINNFTIEAFIYNGTTGTRKFIVGQGDSTAFPNSISFAMEKNASNKLSSTVVTGGTSYAANSASDIPNNQWVHVAFVRNGNTGTNYINGTADGTVDLTGISVNNSPNEVGIGAIGEYTSLLWVGYISNLRIVNGTAIYTSNFTPPNAPLTAISGTSLLTCQSSTFKDNSPNNFTITANGDVSVSTFNPF